MKYYTSLALQFLLLSTFFLGGCNDFFDINEDPNSPSNVPVEEVFASGLIATAAQINGEYNILGCIWSQYYTQNKNGLQYRNIDSYAVTQNTLNQGYSSLYAGALTDFERVRTLAEASSHWDIYLMATVMQCYVFQFMTDTYGDIPFEDALKGDEGIIAPDFNTGSEVYDGLIERIDFAVSQFNSGNFSSQLNLDQHDFIFKGAMSQWLSFAHTLKLKIFLRQRFVRPEIAKNGIESLLNDPDVSFLSGNAAIDFFTDVDQNRNPMYQNDQLGLNSRINLAASLTSIAFLQEHADPRVDSLYIAGSAGHLGFVQGNYTTTNSYPADTLSRARLKPNDPVVFISAAEAQFLLSEAELVYGNINEAKVNYDMGIALSFAELAPQASVDGFTGDGRPYAFNTSLSVDSLLEKIIVQKWISMNRSQGMEAFFERQRTGYPVSSGLDGESVEADRTLYTGEEVGKFLQPVTSVISGFPRRLPLPAVVRNANGNTPPEKGLTEPIWWFRDNGNSLLNVNEEIVSR